MKICSGLSLTSFVVLLSCDYSQVKVKRGAARWSDDGCCLAMMARVYTVLATHLLLVPHPPTLDMY